MSHWAEIDENNIVLRVIVGDNNEPDEGKAFAESLGGRWVQTSYNGSFRGRFAGTGMIYDEEKDEFVKVHPSEPPQDGNVWVWESDEMGWVVDSFADEAGEPVSGA